MKYIASLFSILLITMMSSPLLEQTPTVIQWLSISGQGAQGVTVLVRVTETDGVTPVTSNSGFTVQLCTYGMTYCMDYCAGNVNASGQGSCTLDVNVPPGEYMLLLHYSGSDVDAPSEFKQPVAGDGGGGISPV